MPTEPNRPNDLSDPFSRSTDILIEVRNAQAWLAPTARRDSLAILDEPAEVIDHLHRARTAVANAIALHEATDWPAAPRDPTSDPFSRSCDILDEVRNAQAWLAPTTHRDSLGILRKPAEVIDRLHRARTAVAKAIALHEATDWMSPISGDTAGD